MEEYLYLLDSYIYPPTYKNQKDEFIKLNKLQVFQNSMQDVEW